MHCFARIDPKPLFCFDLRLIQKSLTPGSAIMSGVNARSYHSLTCYVLDYEGDVWCCPQDELWAACP
jgi:hypothetical protein